MRRCDRLSAFVAALGYSRASFVCFIEQEDFPVWRECLEGAHAMDVDALLI